MCGARAPARARISLNGRRIAFSQPLRQSASSDTIVPAAGILARLLAPADLQHHRPGEVDLLLAIARRATKVEATGGLRAVTAAERRTTPAGDLPTGADELAADDWRQGSVVEA